MKNYQLSQISSIVSDVSSSLFIYLVSSYILKNSYIPLLLLSLMLTRSLFRGNPGRWIPNFGNPARERKGLLEAIVALKNYEQESRKFIDRKYTLFSRMPLHHRRLSASVGYLDRLDQTQEKFTANQKFLNQIADWAINHYHITSSELRFTTGLPNSNVVELLGLLVRDWALDTQSQRNRQLEPVLAALKKAFKDNHKTGHSSTGSPEHSTTFESSTTVLVPGSGLSRAALEIANAGFKVDACDNFALMTLCSRFIMECALKQEKLEFSEISPFIHQFSHQISKAYQQREIQLPDEPSSFHVLSNLNVNTIELTNIEGSHLYDAIVTLFFIDTAENVFQYLETIDRLLKPNGIWINMGPLKWGTAPQVEFTLEELKEVIEKMGWHFTEHFEGENEYIPDQHALWHGLYETRGWVARRVSELS
jgi:hypothetical protein